MPSWNVGGKVSYLSIPNAIEIIAFLTSFIMVFTCKLQPGKNRQEQRFLRRYDRRNRNFRYRMDDGYVFLSTQGFCY